jgi:uncharacterized membrane protein
MVDWQTLAAIGALALTSYAMRVGGFLTAGPVQEHGAVSRFLRLAPGNLFIAFVAAGCLTGGWPSLAGCLSALSAMALTNKEWAALGIGFAAAAATSAIAFW